MKIKFKLSPRLQNIIGNFSKEPLPRNPSPRSLIYDITAHPNAFPQFPHGTLIFPSRNRRVLWKTLWETLVYWIMFLSPTVSLVHCGNISTEIIRLDSILWL